MPRRPGLAFLVPMAGLLLCSLLFIGMVVGWAMAPAWQGLFISQIKDRNGEGVVMVVMLAAIAGLSGQLAWGSGQVWSAVVRFAIVVFVLIILGTGSRSPLHDPAFVVCVLLAGAAVLQVADSCRRCGQEIPAFLIVLALALLLGWNGAWTPLWQKALLVFLVLVETAYAAFCLPAELAPRDRGRGRRQNPPRPAACSPGDFRLRHLRAQPG